MSSFCQSIKTTQRAQVDALQHLCTKAEKKRDNCPEFCVLLAQIHPLFEELRKENLPESEELSQLSERVTSLQLATFNLPGLCEIQEIAFPFFSYLSSQDKIPFLCVNKDWNTAFQEFAQMETHNKVTAHLGCLKHNLAVLDAHLDAPFDQETASSIRWLIRNPIQRTLQNFGHAHVYQTQNWSVFDVEDIEADIQSTLANALKAVDPQNCHALFSCIRKDHPLSLFESLGFLPAIFQGLDQPNLSAQSRDGFVRCLVAHKQFGKAYEQIPLIDAKYTRRTAATNLINTLIKVGRLNEALQLCQILATDPTKWFPIEEPDHLPGIYVTCAIVLCEQHHFNKAIEVMQTLKQDTYHYNRGLHTVAMALANNQLFKKAIDTALMGTEPRAQINTLSCILILLIESKKFAEAAELVLVMRQVISEISVSPDTIIQYSKRTITQYSEWVILCAEYTVQIPEKYFEKKGTNQTSILRSLVESMRQIRMLDAANKIEQLIPADNKQ